MNGKDTKAIIIAGFVLLLIFVVAGRWFAKYEAIEIKETLQQQQAIHILLATELLPKQAPRNASGLLFLNRTWLKTSDSSLIACKITGQTVDTIWNMADSTFKIERETNVIEDTIWVEKQ